MGAAALRRENVHLPGIIVQRDTRRRGDPLALLHQLVHDAAEGVGTVAVGEVRIVREVCQRRHRVDRRVENQLRPLRRPQILERPRLQSGADDQVGCALHRLVRRLAVRSEPRLGVEDVLDLGVAATVPAHERDSRDERPVAVAADDLLRPEPVLDGHDRRTRKVALERGGRLIQVSRLGRHDAQVGIPELGRIGGRLERRREVVAAGDAQAVLAQRTRVFLPPREHDDLRHLREMRRVQAADCPGPDDADARAVRSVQP